VRGEAPDASGPAGLERIYPLSIAPTPLQRDPPPMTSSPNHPLLLIVPLVVLAASGPASAQATASLKGQRNTITVLAFSPKGDTLASGAKDGVVILWDLPTGRARASLPGHKDMVTAVAFTPDGKALASASHHSAITVW